jgi:hypothetical protein
LQCIQANKHHTIKFPLSIGSSVQASTLHQCNKFKAKGEKLVAKLMPQYDVGKSYWLAKTERNLHNKKQIFSMRPASCLMLHNLVVLNQVATNHVLDHSHANVQGIGSCLLIVKH